MFQTDSRTGKLSPLFAADGRALIVALDHLPSGFMKGWEFPEETLTMILEGQPDGILANFGIIKRFASLLAHRTRTLLRIDGGPSYLLEDWPRISRWTSLYSVEDALNLGASAVMANLFIGGPLELDSLRIATTAAADCLKYGLFCSLEAIPSESVAENPFEPELISFSCRMAAEFGADFVKTYYTGDPHSFRRVTTRCPIPVLIAGGPRSDNERVLFETVKASIDAGGCGAVVGRNVWQHEKPVAMLRGLKHIIHDNMTVAEAVREFADRQ